MDIFPPYFENSLTFNAAYGRAIGLFSIAFVRVKAWWQLLARRWTEECTKFFPFVIVVGCLLHIFLTKCGQSLLEESLGRLKEEELLIFYGEEDENGCRIRDVLTQHLSLVSKRSWIMWLIMPVVASLLFCKQMTVLVRIGVKMEEFDISHGILTLREASLGIWI